MDEFYPTSRARMFALLATTLPESYQVNQLEHLTSEIVQRIAALEDPAYQHLSQIELQATKPIRQNQQYKLYHQNTDGSETIDDEVQFIITGIMSEFNFIPRINRNFKSLDKLHKILQGVGLCVSPDLGGLQNLKVIENHFDRAIPAESFTSTPLRNDQRFGNLFRASNRFFSSKSEVPFEQDVEFWQGMDPTGKLKVYKGNLLHTVENVVEFKKLVTSPDGGTEAVIASPADFNVGDIVDVQFSCVAIPVDSHDNFKVTYRLRAVTLLSSEFTKEATTNRNRATMDMSSFLDAPFSLRRKVGKHYVCDLTGNPAKRMNA